MTRLLVIRLGAMGDILHASASLTLLPDDVTVDWLTSPLYAPLVRHLPRVSQARVWDKRGGWPAYCRLIQDLGAYDGVINWQPSLKTWWLARQVTAGCVATYRKQKLPVRGQAVRTLERRHAVEDFAQPVYQWLSRTGLPAYPQPLIPTLNPPAIPITFDPAYTHIGLVPGVGHKRGNRAVPLLQWMQWLERDGLSRLNPPDASDESCPLMWHLFGGPDDQALCVEMEQLLTRQTPSWGPVINHANQWSILETAALMAQCAYVLGGDTGPTHLAAAVGASVIAPYGPTDSRRTGPRSPKASVLTPDPALACWPCEKPTCHLPPSRRLACLQAEPWLMTNQ